MMYLTFCETFVVNSYADFKYSHSTSSSPEVHNYVKCRVCVCVSGRYQLS